MSQNKYPVLLSQEQREMLVHRLATGTAPTGDLTHAGILLKADQSQAQPRLTDQQIAQALEVSRATVLRVRQRFVQAGLPEEATQREQLEAVLRRAARVHRPRKLDGVGEAHVIAIACGPAPEGHSRWSLRLLADRLVQLGEVDHISPETVRQVLKKTRSSPG
jgi:hypothetical protein